MVMVEEVDVVEEWSRTTDIGVGCVLEGVRACVIGDMLGNFVLPFLPSFFFANTFIPSSSYIRTRDRRIHLR